MKKDNILQKKLDELLPKLLCIDKHILRSHEPLIKEYYLSFLAAIAFEDSDISSKEANYLKALCSGIGDLDYDKVISKIDSVHEHLEDILKSVQHEKLALWLFLDALIISRIDQDISPKEADLLGRIADGLMLSRAEVTAIVSFATVVLAQDMALLLQLIPTLQHGFPLIEMYEAYLSSWMTEKLSFARDLLQPEELRGKYLLLGEHELSGELKLKDMELVFSTSGALKIKDKAKVTFSNVKLSGSCISVGKEAELAIENCSFSGGYGIHAKQSNFIDIKKSIFENSSLIFESVAKIAVSDETRFTAFQNQRAILAKECPVFTMDDCFFENCGYDLKHATKESGGAMNIQNSSIRIVNTKFQECKASDEGGAVFFWESMFSVSKCKFEKCLAAVNGGAILSHTPIKSKFNNSFMLAFFKTTTERQKPSPIISDSEFLECHALADGGAFCDHFKAVRLHICSITRCSAKQKGGGVCYLGEASNNLYTLIKQCDFIENAAPIGNGLWMHNYRCNSSTEEAVDVYGSSFHKCATNHDHKKNSVSIYSSCYFFDGCLKNIFTN